MLSENRWWGDHLFSSDDDVAQKRINLQDAGPDSGGQINGSAGFSQPIPWSSSPDYHRFSIHDIRQSATKNDSICYHNGCEGGNIFVDNVESTNQLSTENHDDPAGLERSKYFAPVRLEPLARGPGSERELKREEENDDHESEDMFMEDRLLESSLLEEKEPTNIAEALPLLRGSSQIILSREQKQVLDLVVNEGRSIFFTGAAGTGKSVLLRRMIADLKKKHGAEEVAVTAATGIAAFSIGGTTVHSFAGVGLGKEDAETLVRRIRRGKAAKRWKRLKVLLIDEISMIPADLLEKLEIVAQRIRRSRAPFGGVQVILTGDFFQLPPVQKDDIATSFAFEAPCWNKVVERTIVLSKVFRQNDNKFARMLNEMREGRMSEDTIKTFSALDRKIVLPQGITPTKLFPLRYQVENANTQALNNLPGQVVQFEAIDVIKEQGKLLNVNLDNCPALPSVELKVGAQVMMIKNIDSTLVNGSLGRIVGFMNEATFMYRQHDCSVLPAPITERLMQRAEKLGHLNKKSGVLYPVVNFLQQDGTFREHLILPETWVLEDDAGHTLASRTQVPLILAWALSIHKSQGQTLNYVQVDLDKVFERGQAYVAVSRCTSLDGLELHGFHPRKVMVHEKVLRFYQSLEVLNNKRQRQMTIDNMFAPKLVTESALGTAASDKTGETDIDHLDLIKEGRSSTSLLCKHPDTKVANIREGTQNV